MLKRLAATAAVILLALTAGCSSRPTATVIGQFNGYPVLLGNVIYTPELRNIVEHAIEDAKTRILFARVQRSQDMSPLSDAEVRIRILQEIRNAGSMDKYLDELERNRVDWDSLRRSIEVDLMRERLYSFLSAQASPTELESYIRDNWQEAQSALARRNGIPYGDVPQDLVIRFLRDQFGWREGRRTFQGLISEIADRNLLEDPSVEIIDEDQVIVRILHEREPNAYREFRSDTGDSEYFGSTVLTSRDLYGRRDFIGALSEYFIRRGLNDWVRDLVQEDEKYRTPDDLLQRTMRREMDLQFPDSEDPLEDLYENLADRNLPIEVWKNWVTLDVRVKWALDRYVEVSPEEARRIFIDSEEQNRSVLADKLGIEHTRVDIDDPQMLETFRGIIHDGRVKIKRRELQREMLDKVDLDIKVPVTRETRFRLKTMEEITAEEHGGESASHGEHSGGHDTVKPTGQPDHSSPDHEGAEEH
jgi:hypothetical protein